MADKRLLISIDDETRRKLTAIAKEENRSMAGEIRNLINERYDALFVAIPKIEIPTNGKIVYPQRQE